MEIWGDFLDPKKGVWGKGRLQGGRAEKPAELNKSQSLFRKSLF